MAKVKRDSAADNSLFKLRAPSVWWLALWFRLESTDRMRTNEHLEDERTRAGARTIPLASKY